MMTEHLILLLMTAFAVKHWLCDFVLQTPHQVATKGQYGSWGGISHALTHGVGTAAVLILFAISGAGPYEIAFLASLDAVFHYHIDWFKQRMTQGMTAAHPKFWTWLGFDQLLHTLTYVIIIALIH
jgi:hypothetical protein